MLSLILSLAIVSWVTYCLIKKKKIFPKEFFFGRDENCEVEDKCDGDESCDGEFECDKYYGRLMALFLVPAFILISYYGMITYLTTYDSKIAQINELKNNIVQLELQIDKLDNSIEDLLINSNLSEEESITLNGLIAYRAELEKQLATNKAKLSELPGNLVNGRDFRKLYRFLLYFG